MMNQNSCNEYCYPPFRLFSNRNEIQAVKIHRKPDKDFYIDLGIF